MIVCITGERLSNKFKDVITINITNEEIIEKYSDLVYRVAVSQVKNKTDADDIFQEVFVSLVKNISKIESEEHLKHWLIRATINRAKNFHLSFWRKNFCSLEEEHIQESGICEEHFAVYAIRNEINALPQKLKAAVYLYYYEEYTTEEISKILQVPIGTVKSRLHKARNTLKPKLTEVCENGK